jgi:hypothetical protein
MLAQAVVGPTLDTAAASENVKLGWDAKSKTCSVQVHGAEVGDPREEAGRTALLAALPDFDRRIHLLGGADVPFLCLQATTETLQRSGRPYKVGFVSEPLRP